MSCKEDPTVRVPAKMQLENQDATTGISTLNFRSAGSTQTFSIQAEGDWYVRHPKDVNWVTMSPSKGTGDAVLSVRVDSHDGEDPRSATFAFVCDGLEQKGLLKVTQAQKYYVEASVLSNVVSKSGGDITVTLKSNGTPTCTIDDSGSSWLQVV
ncbi:MAG: BACON domain-containing protein, partial [Candidatus Cryptobacteroides sp.]